MKDQLQQKIEQSKEIRYQKSQSALIVKGGTKVEHRRSLLDTATNIVY